MSSRISTSAFGLALLVLALPHAGRTASAQCQITGPSSICDGDFSELCAPPGFVYEWTMPDGEISEEICVPVFGPGVWTLRMMDPRTSQWTECSHEVVLSGGGVDCLIEGPTSACEGTLVTLCGPEGAASWNWSGPGDFTSSDRCIEVPPGGSYTLSVPGSTECGGGSMILCSHEVTATTCGTVHNCPRPAAFWQRGCRDYRGDQHSRITPTQLDQVAACLDARVELFDWRFDPAGFCRTLRPHNVNLRTKAMRQFAAVWANVCAGEAGVVPTRGPAVGLDPLARVTIGSSQQTVSGWLSETEATLTTLAGASLRNREVRRAYTRIIHAGWLINHGQGVEPVCGAGKGGLARMDGMEEDLVGDESLTDALLDETDAPMSLELAGPNPFTSTTTLSFMLGSADPREVNLGVYDISGRLVKKLSSGMLQPGRHEFRWDGVDTGGAPVRNGMYFVIGNVSGERVDKVITKLR